MPVQPLHCKHCQGVFLPASDQPWAAVQCPHCSGQMSVAECRAAQTAVAPAVQEYKPVSEAEQAAEALAVRQNRWTGRLALAGVMILAGLLGLFLWRQSPRGGQEAGGVTGSAFAAEENQGAAGQQWQVVQQFLSAREWKALLPWVADSPRVLPLMEWYYSRAQRPLSPMVPTAMPEVIPLEAGDGGIVRVRAELEDGKSVWLLLHRTGSGWKVDWEAWSSAAVMRWSAFLKESPGATVELKLLAARKPAATGYIVKQGGDPLASEALVLWAFTREASAVALVPASALQDKLLAGIGFDDAIKVIARVTLVDPQVDPPQVRLDQVVQRGWARADEG